MKKSLYIISFFLIGSFVQISHAQVASYPFTGNANDISGNNHNGVVNGAVLSVDRNGNPASAYSFNGSNQSISIAYHSDFNIIPSGQFTISLWVNPASFNSSARALFIKCNNGLTPMNSQWDYGIYLFNNNEIMIGHHNTHVCFSTTQLQVGQWYCVTATYSNGSWKLYINGLLESQSLNSGLYITQSTSGIGIGKKGESIFDHFDGKLDDVKFYNVALTAAQVSSLCALPTSNIPVSNFIASDTVFCFNQSGNCVNFMNQSTGASSRQWLFPGATPSSDTSLNPINICYHSPGTYTVTLISANSAGFDSVSSTITVFPDPAVTFTLPVNQFCIDALPVSLSGGTPTGGLYSGSAVGAGSFSPTLAGIGPHTITYSYSDANVCSDSASTSVLVIQEPRNFITGDHRICEGDELRLKSSSALLSSYQWSGPANYFSSSAEANINPAFSFQSGLYILTASCVCGIVSDTFDVTVIPSIDHEILLNAFSPNGDSKNDIYSLDAIQEFDMRIFNRWGEELIELTPSKRFWDGTCDGKEVPIGIYFYTLKATNCKGEAIERVGTISLFR